jgi:hypothetical protein
MIKTNMNVIKIGELMTINVLFPGSGVLVVSGFGDVVVGGVLVVDELVVVDDVLVVDELVVIDVRVADELVNEDSEFRYSVRDRNAFKADSSSLSKGSKIRATFS